MQSLFNTARGAEVASSQVSTRNIASARHPSRYRINLAVGRLPMHHLYLDEIPTFTRTPPRLNEPTLSLRIEHHPNCPRPTDPRQRVTSFISTFGTTAPTTRTLIKVCPRCLNLYPHISPTNHNESYALITQHDLPAWNLLTIIDRPTYHTLPPHTCAHTHCLTPDNCTCTSQLPADGTTPCPHTHCATPDACICTTRVECVNISDHLPATDEPHRNCHTPHCPEPEAHTALPLRPNAPPPPPPPPPPPSEPTPTEPRFQPRSITLTLWTIAVLDSFLNSSHGASFATGTSNLQSYLEGSLTSHASYVTDLSRDWFPPVPIRENSALFIAVYTFHSPSTINDITSHATHNCDLVLCPLTLLAELRTSANTLGRVSFSQFQVLYRTRFYSLLS
jgi:hypothetical protein